MQRISKVVICSLVVVLLLAVQLPAFAQDEPVTIRYQDWRLAEEPAGPSLTAMVNAFMEANPNIVVELEPVTVADKLNVFTTQFRGGDAPDVVRILTTDVPPFIDMGALQSLEPLVEAAGGDEFTSQYVGFLINAMSFNSELYCVPHEGDAFLIFLNTRLWEEAGLDPDNPPTTFDELLEANAALTDASEGRYAFGMLAEPAIAAIWMQSWFLTNGTDFFNEDYTDTLLDTPEAIDAFKFYTGMVTEDHVVPPGPTEVNYGAQIALFAQEQVAYIIGPYATLGSIVGANPELADYVKAVPFPGSGVTAGRGSGLCMSSATEGAEAEAAWQLMQWLTTEENQLTHFAEATMMPTRKSALEKIDFDAYPVAQVMVEEAIPLADSYPVFVKWPQAKVVIDEALGLTLLGEVDAETAMIDAAARIREILQEE